MAYRKEPKWLIEVRARNKWLEGWLADESRRARAEAAGLADHYNEFASIVAEGRKKLGLAVDRLVNYLQEPTAGERYQGGTIPYGWAVNDCGQLVEDPEGQAVIDHIIVLRRAGASQRAVAATLKAEGVSISRTTIQRILRRQRVWKALQVNPQTRAAVLRARGLRRVFLGLAGYSAWKATKELNRRGIPTPQGGRWHPNSVRRVRARLAARGVAGPKSSCSPVARPQG